MNESVEPNTKDQEEILVLLNSLVRTHYLEKSKSFHSALEFEKLFKLDRLDLLKHLEELDKLRALSDLNSLEHLKELSRLRELSHLSELKPLSHLEKLDELKELTKLDQLKNLIHLEKLDELNALENLLKLEQLKELSKLKELSQLSELAQLENLKKLDDLKSLSKLELLESLKKLDQLSSLKELSELSSLKELEKLESIKTLGVLLQNHKNELAPIAHLEKLTELIHLRDLEKLKDLEKLSRLEHLNKLDRLDDARFAERLDKLDKLDILQKGTRSLVLQQIFGLGLEFIKLMIAGLLITFLLSRETGREIAVKTLPAIGFGHAAQMNLGLKLLVGETSPENFSSIIIDVRKRIDSEIDTIFSLSSTFKITRRLEMLDQLQSYSFQGSGIDLASETAKKIEVMLAKNSAEAADQLEYDQSIARGKLDAESEVLFREIRILLIQKQYPQLLEKVLPLWGKSDSLTRAAVVGVVSLKMQDPETLRSLIRSMPGSGVL